MAEKKTKDKDQAAEAAESEQAIDAPEPARVLTCKQDVADELKMSFYQFEKLLRKYPFRMSGAAGKLNGRWHVAVDDVWRWYQYVQRQEIRHPDSRRMRPEEPPEISNIKGR